MTTMKILTPVAFVAALALAASPAQAQHRSGGGGGQRSGGSRSSGGVSRSAPSGSARARAYPVYRGGGVRVAPRIIGSRGVIVGGPRFYQPYYSFRPRISLGFGLWAGYPVSYPYYYGYPYGYPYPYPADPYGYSYPGYGYPAQPYPSSNQYDYPSNDPSAGPDYGQSSGAPAGRYPQQQSGPSIGVQRGDQQRGDQSAPGGVSFEITPNDAAIFVDGTYVGTANEFGPTSQPMGLIPGRHHIEIRASGYRTMTFDTDITAGQVMPYQGTLQRN